MGGMRGLLSLLLLSMLTACASLGEKHLLSAEPSTRSKQPAEAMGTLLADYARFVEGDEKRRSVLLDEAGRARDKAPEASDKALRHALLLSFEQSGQALEILQKLPWEKLDEAHRGLRALLLRQLRQQRDLRAENHELKRELLVRKKIIAKLRAQIEALKLIDKTLFEQENSLMLDGR